MSHETHTTRRVKFGVSVFIAVAAAIAITVLINWVAYMRLVNIRMDMTSTRKHSLAPQTENVLDSLEGEFEIVALLSRTNVYIEQVRDLVEEYGVRSGSITTTQIDPTRNISQLETFYAKLEKRFESDITPQKEKIEAARAAMKDVQNDIRKQLELLTKLSEAKLLTNPDRQKFVTDVTNLLKQFNEQAKDFDGQIETAIGEKLPNLSGISESLATVFQQYDRDIYGVAIQEFQKMAETEEVPNAAKEQLLRLKDEFAKTKTTLSKAAEDVKFDVTNDEYANLRNQLNSAELVVVLGPTQIRVLRVEDMFRQLNEQEQQMAAQEGDVQLGFLGEEKLTGALIAMSLKHPPMVVFVQGGQRPVIGPGGQYDMVAQRLRALNFDVRDWSPMGKRNPMTGQPMPAGPPPEPKDGQRVVWVVPPIEANPQQMMMQGGGGGAQQIMQELGPRIESGDSAILMITLNPMARFGQPDPVSELVSTWDIEVQTDSIILSQIVGPDRRPMVQAMHPVDQWPTESPITMPIQSMQGVFAQASPMNLAGGEKQGVTLKSLATIQGEKLWAENDLQNQNPRYNEEKSAGSYTVAVAAERDENRLVVVSDGVWATNGVVNYGIQGLPAELVGAQFPANAELFVNSTLWLAGLDQLIAASARSQDIRRIEPMEESSLMGIQWSLLLLLPLAIIACGVSVWVVRRRG